MLGWRRMKSGPFLHPCPLIPTLLLALAASSLAAPPPTGAITRHEWYGIGGTAVADLTGDTDYPESPDVATTSSSFHAPVSRGENFGTRMFGWVHAPVSGDYTFWIHGDDNCELWLSTSRYPGDRVLVASVPDWTDDGEWNKFPEQQSTTIPLVAGEYYFIEALHKEGAVGDNLGVAWSYPGQARSYIPGSQLSEWQNLPPDANTDSVTLGIGDTIAVNVLANDRDPNGRGDLDPSTLQVVSDPAAGSYTLDLDHDRIVYTHTGTTVGGDQLSYEIRDQAGEAATTTLDLTISDALRLPQTTSTVPLDPPAESIAFEDAFPGVSFSEPVAVRSAPGDSRRLWVCEKTGDLELIPDVTAASPGKVLFLNVDGIVNARSGESFTTTSECGLLAAAFHPDYADNGWFFTVYDLLINGTRHQRLSRWIDPDPSDNTAAGATEQVLIEQTNVQPNHNGGDLHFGPDGYLYMSWGDEGAQNDSIGNSQHIDGQFWSSIIRIDVDLEDGVPDDGNLPPNPHPSVVLHDGAALYEVPADNPWAAASSFNGRSIAPAGDIDPADVRTEFYAVGFRNPWRFSFDPVTGDLICGDVGQDQREEITLVTLGSNHGWSWREGDIPGSRAGQLIDGAGEGDATLTEPLYAYAHGNGEFQGNSVTGGVVHRGDRVASLYGHYLFADFNSGNVWSWIDDPDIGPTVERILGEANIAAFGTDPSNGDTLAVDYGDGRLLRIVDQDVDDGFPRHLADTGMFSDLSDSANLVPNPGLVPYDVNLRFWTDDAVKQRWFMISNTSDIFGFSAEGNWTHPTGAIWVKHFEMLQDDSDPESGFPLETRLIVKTADGNYGVSYRWNSAGTEAVLAPAEGVDFSFTVTADGQPREQTWHIPSRAECARCHNPAAGHALSFNTRQLNHDGHYHELGGNFLELLATVGYLDSDPGDTAVLPRLVKPDDTTYSLEARVRSYLAANCDYCHRPGGGVPGNPWDARHELTLDQTRLINELADNPLDPADRYVVPGEPSRSIILSRIAETNGYSRMPPIDSNLHDPEGIALLTEWITEEATGEVSYSDWRIARFGDDSSPEGEPGEDPDGDGRSNHEEWLQNTAPLDRASRWELLLDRSQPGTVSYSGLGNRSVVIEHSPDLGSWSRWDVPGNDGLPRNPTEVHELSESDPGPAGFYRAVVEER